MGKSVKMSFVGKNLQEMGKWTEVLCFQKEIDSRGCSDPALGLYSDMYITILVKQVYRGIYLGFQVSIYRTSGLEFNSQKYAKM